MAEENKKEQKEREVEKIWNTRKYLERMWKRARINAFAHRYERDRYKRLTRTNFVWQVILSLGAIIAVILVYAIPSVFESSEGRPATVFESSEGRPATVFESSEGRPAAVLELSEGGPAAVLELSEGGPVKRRSVEQVLIPMSGVVYWLCDTFEKLPPEEPAPDSEGAGSQANWCKDQELNVPIVRGFQLLLTVVSVLLSCGALFFAIRQADKKNEGLQAAHNINMQLFISIAQRTYQASFLSIGVKEVSRIKKQLEEEFEHLKARGPNLRIGASQGQTVCLKGFERRCRGALKVTRVDGVGTNETRIRTCR